LKRKNETPTFQDRRGDCKPWTLWQRGEQKIQLHMNRERMGKGELLHGALNKQIVIIRERTKGDWKSGKLQGVWSKLWD